MRIILMILGIVLAAVGGVIAYRALFLEPTAAVVISESGVRELPDYFRVTVGALMLVAGAVLAFVAGTRK